jgi:hypothetical protein
MKKSLSTGGYIYDENVAPRSGKLVGMEQQYEGTGGAPAESCRDAP